MNSIKTLYRIQLRDELTEAFDYEMDAETLEIVAAPRRGELPAWTKLGFKQCPNCPMAVQLHPIVERFHDAHSIDEVAL